MSASRARTFHRAFALKRKQRKQKDKLAIKSTFWRRKVGKVGKVSQNFESNKPVLGAEAVPYWVLALIDSERLNCSRSTIEKRLECGTK